MKADRKHPARFPEELRRQIVEEDPGAISELEHVWQLLEGATPHYMHQVADADETWRRLNGSLFGETPASAARLDRAASPPSRVRLRHRWLVGASAGAAVVLMLLAFYTLVPVRHSAPMGGILAVTLPDGSRVELNGGTNLSYDRGLGAGLLSRSDVRRVHLEGEAFFDVVQDGRTFTVETFNATVQVLGTEFNVKSWSTSPSNDTRVAVKSGHVRVSPGHVDLLANQSVRISAADEGQSIRQEDDLDLVLNWRKRGFSVLGEPLLAAFMQMERQYGVEIDVNTTLDPQIQIVYYRNEPSLELLLGDLSAAHGLKFRKTLRGYEVYR
ncbi:MAG: FecR domain-containing protein [Rhodothermales bacterium]|nr:FecR domain-containing protein [Rhodothermales bacterium]